MSLTLAPQTGNVSFVEHPNVKCEMCFGAVVLVSNKHRLRLLQQQQLSRCGLHLLATGGSVLTCQLHKTAVASLCLWM
jgi:hypothetical protein